MNSAARVSIPTNGRKSIVNIKEIRIQGQFVTAYFIFEGRYLLNRRPRYLDLRVAIGFAIDIARAMSPIYGNDHPTSRPEHNGQENGFEQSYDIEHVSNINNSDQQNDKMMYSSNQGLNWSREATRLLAITRLQVICFTLTKLLEVLLHGLLTRFLWTLSQGSWADKE